MFDWPTFLEQNQIPYVTEGPNTPQGALGIKCPFCGEADPSEHMVLRPFGAYACWRDRSHRAGNPIKLIQALLGCSFARAHEIAGPKLGPAITSNMHADLSVNLTPLSTFMPTKALLTYPSWPDDFRAFSKLYAATPFLEYLSRRGLHDITKPPTLPTRKYNIYYCVTGAFKGRIIFPVVADGHLISWTGRTIYPSNRRRYQSLTTDPGKAELIGCDPAAAPLNHALLWQDELRGGEVLLIVEGPFDALKVRVLGEQDGIQATCLFTSMPTPKQVTVLRRVAPLYKRVVLLLDEDAKTKSLTVQSRLITLGLDRAWLTKGDPGDLNHRDQLLELLGDHSLRV